VWQLNASLEPSARGSTLIVDVTRGNGKWTVQSTRTLNRLHSGKSVIDITNYEYAIDADSAIGQSRHEPPPLAFYRFATPKLLDLPTWDFTDLPDGTDLASTVYRARHPNPEGGHRPSSSGELIEVEQALKHLPIHVISEALSTAEGKKNKE
jgi:hypothetical protein